MTAHFFAIILGFFQFLLVIVMFLFKRILKTHDDRMADHSSSIKDCSEIISELQQHTAKVDEYMKNRKESDRGRAKWMERLETKLDTAIKESKTGAN